MKVKFKKLSESAEAPVYSSASAAGADLHSTDEYTVNPGETVMIKTGIAAELPEGYAGLVFARSGLACKRGLAPANKVGVIDSDYRGEIIVALHNHSQSAQTVGRGERVAQLVIVPYLRVEFEEAGELDETKRGCGGFGSTGK